MVLLPMPLAAAALAAQSYRLPFATSAPGFGSRIDDGLLDVGRSHQLVFLFVVIGHIDRVPVFIPDSGRFSVGVVLFDLHTSVLVGKGRDAESISNGQGIADRTVAGLGRDGFDAVGRCGNIGKRPGAAVHVSDGFEPVLAVIGIGDGLAVGILNGCEVISLIRIGYGAQGGRAGAFVDQGACGPGSGRKLVDTPGAVGDRGAADDDGAGFILFGGENFGDVGFTWT